MQLPARPLLQATMHGGDSASDLRKISQGASALFLGLLWGSGAPPQTLPVPGLLSLLFEGP